jgi:hypothetical protein
VRAGVCHVDHEKAAQPLSVCGARSAAGPADIIEARGAAETRGDGSAGATDPLEEPATPVVVLAPTHTADDARHLAVRVDCDDRVQAASSCTRSM